jgi:hypothetical protein
VNRRRMLGYRRVTSESLIEYHIAVRWTLIAE